MLLSTMAAVAVAFLSFATPAHIDAATKRATVLTLQAPTKLDLGAHPQVTVRLTADGGSVPGQLISIKIGDQVSKQVTTGPAGSATVTITRDLSAGTYQFSATFAGSSTYRSATSGTVILTVNPAVLAIATVPAMPNMPLVVVGRGTQVNTGPDGVALVKVGSVGPLALQLALPADTASERVRLDRWDDGSTALVRTIRIPDTLQVTVALQLFHAVQFTFHTPTGAAVANSGVPFVDISDDAGNVTRLSGPAPYWIEANAITRLTTGFSSAVPEYRIVSVQLGGSEVVNRGQQRFTADVAKTVPVELLVFDLVIQGRDALLKSAAGSKATITSTDGVKYFADLDRSGQATVTLPRGEYRILLGNGIGIPLSTPVALSRDQGVDVLFITPLDVLLVLGTGLLVAFALVAIGRPQVLRMFARPRLPRLAMGLPAAKAPSPPVAGSVGLTDAAVDASLPSLSWPDPEARLSAPERVQRPKPEPMAPSALAAVVDLSGEEGPPEMSLIEVLERHRPAQRRRASKPSTSPTAGPTKRSGARTHPTSGARGAGSRDAPVSTPPIEPTGKPARKPTRAAATEPTTKAARGAATPSVKRARVAPAKPTDRSVEAPTSRTDRLATSSRPAAKKPATIKVTAGKPSAASSAETLQKPANRRAMRPTEAPAPVASQRTVRTRTASTRRPAPVPKPEVPPTRLTGRARDSKVAPTGTTPPKVASRTAAAPTVGPAAASAPPRARTRTPGVAASEPARTPKQPLTPPQAPGRAPAVTSAKPDPGSKAAPPKQPARKAVSAAPAAAPRKRMPELRSRPPVSPAQPSPPPSGRTASAKTPRRAVDGAGVRSNASAPVASSRRAQGVIEVAPTAPPADEVSQAARKASRAKSAPAAQTNRDAVTLSRGKPVKADKVQKPAATTKAKKPGKTARAKR